MRKFCAVGEPTTLESVRPEKFATIMGSPLEDICVGCQLTRSAGVVTGGPGLGVGSFHGGVVSVY